MNQNKDPMPYELLSCLHLIQYMATIPVNVEIETELVHGTIRFFKALYSGYALYYSDNRTSVITYRYPDKPNLYPQELTEAIQEVFKSGLLNMFCDKTGENIIWIILPININFKTEGVWFIAFPGQGDLPKIFIDGLLGVASYIGTLFSDRASKLTLIENAEKYQLVSDYTYDWEFWKSSTGYLLYCSPSCYRISGYDREEFLHNPDLILDIVYPEDYNQVREYWNKSTDPPDDDIPWECEFRIIKKDRELRWIHLICISVFGKNKKYLGTRGSFRDITERKNAEINLYTYQSHLEEIISERTRDLEKEINVRIITEEKERLAHKHFETLMKLTEMKDAKELDLSEYIMESACQITNSSLAFIGMMTNDESVMDILSWSKATMKDCQVAISPIHFPIKTAGIWADAVRTRKPKIVNDYSVSLPGKKGLPEGHVIITRFLSLPILDKDKVVMVAAVANKPFNYNKEDINRLLLLMQGVWTHFEMRKSENALKESELFNRELVENLPDYIVVYGYDKKILYVNPAVTTALGYRYEEMISIPIISFISDEFKEIGEKMLSSRIQGVILPVYEADIVCRDNNRRSVMIKGTRINYHNQPAILLLMNDITHRKMIEQSLKDNEEKFISIFEETPDPILILNSDYQIVEINRGFLKCFDCSYTDISGKFLDDLSVGLTKKSIEDFFGMKEDDIQTHHIEIVLEKKTNIPFIADVSISRIIINLQPCYIIQIHDIDEIRRAHDAITQVNHKLKILSSITRHDILNRIMVTTVYSDMLVDGITDPDLQRKLNAIKQTSAEIQNIIEFTGQYQNLGESEPTWQEIERLFRIRTVHGLISGINLILDLNGIEIYADNMLEKVIYNLVENSVRHGKNLKQVRLSSFEEEGTLKIWYEDDGGGIVNEEKEKVFEKGFGKNTGLGLFLIREILSITGISIIENGKPGEGVRFEIKVPSGKWRIKGN